MIHREHNRTSELACAQNRVRSHLFVVGFETLDDARDAELEVALCAVERADDQVDNAQVIRLLLRILPNDLHSLRAEFLRKRVRTVYCCFSSSFSMVRMSSSASSFWLVMMYDTHRFASTIAVTSRICS